MQLAFAAGAFSTFDVDSHQQTPTKTLLATIVVVHLATQKNYDYQLQEENDQRSHPNFIT
jgi:hypothetical protein